MYYRSYMRGIFIFRIFFVATPRIFPIRDIRPNLARIRDTSHRMISSCSFIAREGRGKGVS